MLDWNKPIAFKLRDGTLIPASPGLDLDGAGRGDRRAYIYTKQFMSPIFRYQFGADDLGMDVATVDEFTGEGKLGTIVNVPEELLPDYIDPRTGKMKMVSELEVRKRVQEAAAMSGGRENDPVTKVHVTVERESGHKDMLGAVEV